MVTISEWVDHLTQEYTRLFTTEEYSYAAARTTPRALAERITSSLLRGDGNKDGEGIKRTCKHFRIKHTYKAIKEALVPDVVTREARYGNNAPWICGACYRGDLDQICQCSVQVVRTAE